MTFLWSPHYLAYPAFFGAFEWRLFRKAGVTVDAALGGYKGGTVGQLGVRMPFYVVGSFDFGMQLGPFIRGTKHHLPDAESIEPGPFPSTRSAMEAIYHDIELARANGRDAVFAGMLFGGKFIAPWNFWGRGMTLEGGVLFGYHALVGSSGYGPHPEAMRTASGFLPQLYLAFGWSF